jgi:hypothetical protein
MPYDSATYTEVEAFAPDATPAPLTNRQKWLKLRDHIEALSPSKFNMWSTEDCVGGYARRMFGGRTLGEAGRQMGLSHTEARDMFFLSSHCHRAPMWPDAKQAAKVINHYLNTGKVDWGVAGRWWRPVRRAV